MNIYIWQRIISPHMVGLASSLALYSNCEVVYVAEKGMSVDRAQQGWALPSTGGAKIKFASTKDIARSIVMDAPYDSIHICQGIRANGVVGAAQRALYRRKIIPWIILETIDDFGLNGFAKRALYRWIFLINKNKFKGILAIGHNTTNWLIARGVDKRKVFPFTYFLPDIAETTIQNKSINKVFQFIYVGRLVNLKRIDLLISALSKLSNFNFQLLIVGDGPCKKDLIKKANHLLPNKVLWLGQLSMIDAHAKIATSDCLVLPSRYDGWGAVVSEALMLGIPAICSNTCGSAGIVRSSGRGGVFLSGDVRSLSTVLEKTLNDGFQNYNDRLNLFNWSKCLGGESGARYLLNIFSHSGGKPPAPWQKNTLHKSIDL